MIHHAVKLRDRRARLHACAGDGIFFHFKAAGELCAAHAAARVDVIRAAFKHIAESVSRNAAVVVGRKICDWERERKRFAFARLQGFGLCECGEASCGLAELALRCFNENGDDLFALHVAGVFHGDFLCNGLAVEIEAFNRAGEGRVAETVAERIQHTVFCERLKVAVADVDVFFINDPCGITEALCRRIITDVKRDGVAQLAARRDSACENICSTCAALLAALPDVQHSGGIVFFHPLHIHDIADVQQNRNTLERAANLF